jgi:hypothetical protein
VKLKTDNAGVAMPPKVRWWLLAVPFVFVLCAFLGFQHARRFMDESWWWRETPFYPRHPISTGPSITDHSLKCFVPKSGEVSLVSEDVSWDTLSEVLARRDGAVWVVDIELESTFRCLIVPSFERFTARLLIYPAIDNPDNFDQADEERVRQWMIQDGGEAMCFLRTKEGLDLIRTSELSMMRPLWGYILINAGIFGGILLLPWSIVAWCALANRRRYLARLKTAACVSCRYDLAAQDRTQISRCPECGTLNPPRPPPPSPPAPAPPSAS